MNCPRCGYKISRKKMSHELARLGGQRGARALADKMTPEQRSERMRQVVMVRWAKK